MKRPRQDPAAVTPQGSREEEPAQGESAREEPAYWDMNYWPRTLPDLNARTVPPHAQEEKQTAVTERYLSLIALRRVASDLISGLRNVVYAHVSHYGRDASHASVEQLLATIDQMLADMAQRELLWRQNAVKFQAKHQEELEQAQWLGLLEANSWLVQEYGPSDWRQVTRLSGRTIRFFAQAGAKLRQRALATAVDRAAVRIANSMTKVFERDVRSIRDDVVEIREELERFRTLMRTPEVLALLLTHMPDHPLAAALTETERFLLRVGELEARAFQLSAPNAYVQPEVQDILPDLDAALTQRLRDSDPFEKEDDSDIEKEKE